MTDFPAGLPIALDASARRTRDGLTLSGGDPLRALRLSPAGAAALDNLLDADRRRASTAATRRLARTLVDSGLTHPVPPPAAGAATAVTLVIPVRDRATALDRCLAAAGPVAQTIVVDDGSRDPAAIVAVAARHGALLVRLPTSTGPGPARNAALDHVRTPLVAFLDSDCVAGGDWLARLTGHFADPLVAAVAPRVRGTTADGPAGPVARYAAARSPLDRGPRPASVGPGGRVSWVPTAAFLVRRAALADGFDPALRYGEDVDLVWRLHDAGWRVRYDPAVTVAHAEPTRLRALLARRTRYGTSAAPLARRHPGRLSPLVLHPWSTGTAALLLARRPFSAAALALAHGAILARRVRAARVPLSTLLAWPPRGAAQALEALGRSATMLAPLALAAALRPRSTRPAALALLLTPPLAAWVRSRPALDPARWIALAIADDIAYGAGVWTGAVRARDAAALRPRFSRRP